MEIGSFIELEFRKGFEYYVGDSVARLNSGRAAIFHALRVLDCDTIYLPYYQCNSVNKFLLNKGIDIKYYTIDKDFNPKIESYNPENSAVLLVNYYGIMSHSRMNKLASMYQNVILDNSQAFFARPIKQHMNIYSARKFIGVPDGAYVVGKDSNKYINEYQQDFSSDTSLFLLQRIEYGCEGKTYEQRSVNELRIDQSDIKRMSSLTHAILDGTNYDFIKKKRRDNFNIACSLFNSINKLNPEIYYDESCIPMVYPLVIEDDDLLPKLLKNKIFQGHWWSYLLNKVDKRSIEYWLSRYIIPITIDQRYGRNEIEHVYNIIDGKR